MDELLQYSETPDPWMEPALSAQLYELLLHILSARRPLRDSATRGSGDRIAHAANYIRLHCHEPLTLARMAEEADYSIHHFNRLFRSCMGKSPFEFQLENRMVLAKRLLITSSLAIREIALETGFSQSSYFIRRFKELEGLTPQQFREQRK